MKKMLMFLALAVIVMVNGCTPDDIIPDVPKDTVPVVKTGTVAVLSDASASITAVLISNGGSVIIGKGICWGTIAIPEVIDPTMKVDGIETSYSLSLTGLNPATVYYARAYATNKVGTSFGDVVSFTTPSGNPLIVGEATISTTELLAADLSVKVIERGAKTTVTFDYGVSPDLLNKSLVTSSSSESGATEITFTAHLSDLAIGEIYYVRVKATNVNSSVTGSIQNFRPYSVRDVDGNFYHAVKIGSQIWLKENLQTEHYNDGSAITNVTDKVAWTALNGGAYCYYNNDRKNKPVYGALYNFFAIDTKKLAPIGWHVSTDEEWTTMVGDRIIPYPAPHPRESFGAKLKETGTTHWQAPNTGATDEFGFTALPGGGINRYGVFDEMAVRAFFWSSTSVVGNLAWCKTSYYDRPHLGTDWATDQTAGLSVRCVKD